MSMLYRLERYIIHSVAVINNDRFDTKRTAHTGDSEVTLGIAENKTDPLKYMVTLEVQVRPTKGRETDFFPYRIAVKGSAFFGFDKVDSKVEAEHFLRLNGASILYGLLRGQVAQITAQATHGQFLMPMINFVETAKNAAVSEKPPRKKVDRK